MKKVFLIFLIFLGIFSLFSGSYDYRFRGEEPNRLSVSYEMNYLNNFAQPTYLGENYYKKPPLFNWLVISSSKIFGWEKFTGRFVTIFSTVLIILFIFIFSKKYIYNNFEFSIISSLIFLSFLDILFWYGFLAEIDMLLTLIIFLMISSLILAFKKKSFLFLSIASLLSGISFLIKGFPAYAFYFFTILTLTIFYIYKKQFNKNLFLKVFFSVPFLFLFPVLWIINLDNPDIYIKTLWQESIGRVEKSTNLSQFLEHLLMYPILNIKQTLFISGLFLAIVIFKFKDFKKILLEKNLFLIFLIFFINYLPYWISAGSRGRYILPILPFVAILIAFSVFKINKNFYKVAIGIVLFSFILRLIIGLFYFPYETEKKGLYKKIAKDIYHQIPQNYYSQIASNCITHKAIIFYLDVWTQNVILSNKKKPNWKYFIYCGSKISKNYQIKKTYSYKGEKIYLLKR